MGKPFLEVDDFFNGLGELLKAQQERGKGSIYLTQKRGPTTPSSVLPSKDLPEGTDLILIRASDSKNGRSKSSSRTKLTTFVAPSELDKFYERYATMCKAGMLGLKPRDKSKKKSQQKKKKKRAAAATEE
ncbi:hypothetical protein NLU13_5420 [Sarocladium strictum]|uniref:Signal recognition particle subunit SRP14 n=1 Tax=Sarocladium strictum TaxID=5046 RepID=A0AA39L7M1_SARSR|nr:hypothetical protein NLU13_5420 [Sarocladium strictum]